MILIYSQYSNTAPPSSQWQVLQTQGVPSCNRLQVDWIANAKYRDLLSAMVWLVWLCATAIAQNCAMPGRSISYCVWSRRPLQCTHENEHTAESLTVWVRVTWRLVAGTCARAGYAHVVWTAETHDVHLRVRRFVWD